MGAAATEVGSAGGVVAGIEAGSSGIVERLDTVSGGIAKGGAALGAQILGSPWDSG